MKFLDDIKKETLIICDNNYKNYILKMNKLINVKFMDMFSFMSKYLFSYDEEAIIYIMDNYHVKYDVALVYIKNLYYIKNKKYNNKKLDFLVNLFNELNDHKLLKYDDNFKSYIKNIDIIIYDHKLNKLELDMFSNLYYKVIDRDYNNYSHDIMEFNSQEDEIYYVCQKICSLIDSGIDVKNIKLTNVDSSYYNILSRVFSLFNLKINIPYRRALSSYRIVNDYINLLDKYSIKEAALQIDNNDIMYNKLIDVLNKYIKYDNKELIKYILFHSYIMSNVYDNGIEIIDYLNYKSNDYEYIFMIGFNDGIVPNSYKDINYITDNICSLVGLDNTVILNISLRDKIIKEISDIKNLFISYKLKDSKRSFYPSTLCSNFNIVKGSLDSDISYSLVLNKIRLTRSLDEYIKYGYKNSNLDRLYNNYKVDYNSFSNKYHDISRVMDKLTLSYSKMQIYNKCAFRYYLSEVLKLDIFMENFSTVIGSMVHYVMEKCLSNNSMDTDKYVMEYLQDRQFTKKENFFLDKYRDSIKDLLNQVKLESEYCSLDKAMYEKKIDINYTDNIKFTGIIDKILYKEDNNNTYVSLIDYKTGMDDISLKYLKYGINIQLPVYLYLASYLEFKNIIYTGFYLQKFNLTDKDYRLVGYSNSDRDILSMMDNNYDNSSIIKGMKTLKDESFSRYTKVLSNDDIDQVIDTTKNKILEVIDNIKNNKFIINPKMCDDKLIGCEYCKFKDICFVKYEDYEKIKLEDVGEE